MSKFLRAVGVGATILLSAAALVAVNVTTFEIPGIGGSLFIPWLVACFIAVAILALMMIWSFISMITRIRRKIFGSTLALKLGLIFAAVAAAPTLVFYTVSTSATLRSVESWYDIPLDKALNEGVRLGRSLVANQVESLRARAGDIRENLGVSGVTQAQLDALRERHSLQEISLFTGSGRLGAHSADIFSGGRDALSSRSVDIGALRFREEQLRIRREDGQIRVIVTVPVDIFDYGATFRAMRLVTSMPPTVARGIEGLSDGQQQYERLNLLRRGLRYSFLLSLTMTVLIALFCSITLGLSLADRLSRPLGRLIAATQAVARGDFSRRCKVSGKGEISLLMESFNHMTNQLERARADAEHSQAALEMSNVRLETLISNLSAGVLVIGADGKITKVNVAAAEILGVAAAQGVGNLPEDWLSGEEDFVRAIAAAGETESKIDCNGKTLLIRGRPLPGGDGNIVVFDDISRQLQKQREETWSEASRRFAHEIKNPLTPIQLAAERIAKLRDHLPSDRGERLTKSTETIINQVGAMQEMVDSFRRYAGDAPLSQEPLELNVLVKDVVNLYQGQKVKINTDLADGLPPISGNSVLIRQVLINLLNNAAEAVSATPENAHIDIATKYLDNRSTMLSVSDNGEGIPKDLIGRIFEPYVTTKTKGTGLGLAEVKRIVEVNGGSVSVSNTADGVLVEVTLPFYDKEIQQR